MTDAEFNLFKDFETSTEIVYCSHIYTAKKGSIYCTKCGSIIQETSIKPAWNTTHNRFSRTLDSDKTINADIQGMGFSDETIVLANQIYQKCCNGVIRGKMRKGIICTCIYYATNICNKCKDVILQDAPIDVVSCTCGTSSQQNALCFDEVIKIFKIDKKVALKGFKHVNSTNNFSFTSFVTTPETYISFYLKKLSVQQVQINNILVLYENTIKKVKLSSEPRPQSIAAAFIYYWIQQTDKGKIKVDNLASITEVSQLTIEKLEKEMTYLTSAIIKESTFV